MKSICGTILIALAAAAPALAQENPWTWRKAVPAGQTVEIRGIRGDIRASAATGNEVEIIARKSARDSDPASVRIVVDEHAGGVVVCALYDGRSSCDAEGRRTGSSGENDTRVDFEVRLPRGVKFKGRNVSGNVEATGLAAQVSARTVSGNVRVSTSDIAEASTVSGSIAARLGRTDWSGELDFKTVSGDIDVEFAGDVNADVEMSTVSGDIESDWPLAVTTAGRHNIRGRIGAGGRALSFSTVSGSVTLRKAR
ncbi:MAG TPA: DUF4097 family beta strand repeat-containing protein [Longimicrobiales bacterium]|nr:DUF4097 family beta strand repeat-containing protein [Longimicrobiales bacterium]